MALFTEYEDILYLSELLSQKQQIEDGLNRTLTTIRTFSQMIEAFEESSVKHGKVNIILTDSPSEQLNMHYDLIIKSIRALLDNKNLDVVVITIGLSKVFDSDRVYEFGTIPTFVEFARKHERHQRIKELEESVDERDKHGAKLLKELMIEKDALEERYEKLQGKIAEYDELIVNLKAEIQKLNTEIETVYKIELDNKTDASEEYQNEIDELNRQLIIEKKKMEDYTEEANSLRNLNKSLELDLQSVKEYLEDTQNKHSLTKKQVKALQMELEKKDKLYAELNATQVDSEQYAILTSKYQQEEKTRINLEHELNKVNIELRKKEIELNEILIENENLRQGDIDLVESGRTLRFDSHVFDNINLYYFKVIQNLPYFNSHLMEFYNKIKQYYGDKTVICIIKYDEGLDSKQFKGIEVYSNLGNVPRDLEKFILYPSQRMMTNAQDFETKYNNIIVVDYIQSHDYYMDTQSLKRTYNVVRYSDYITEYNLKGLPISLDAKSILDIRHDVRIENANTPLVKQRIISSEVVKMLKQSSLIT